ncbi:MAG: hypothetical protein ACREDU_11930, partial [Methylocella sp.]
MRAWERPHWSGRPRPKSDRQRLKPNIFARLVRVSAKNSGTVFITVLFLAALAASFATLSLRFDP